MIYLPPKISINLKKLKTLVHGYYTIKPKQLWNIIEKDIPVLKPQIENLLNIVDLPEE